MSQPVKRTVVLLVIMLVYILIGEAAAIDHSQLVQDASSGNREAQYTLAHLLLKGRGGFAVDVLSAADWLKKAADNGHRDAAFDLAMLYLEGDRVDKNMEEALAWLTLAAERGHTEAQYYLGLAYKKSNPKRALDWLEKAKDGGHVQAGSDLALLCEKEGMVCR